MKYLRSGGSCSQSTAAETGILLVKTLFMPILTFSMKCDFSQVSLDAIAIASIDRAFNACGNFVFRVTAYMILKISYLLFKVFYIPYNLLLSKTTNYLFKKVQFGVWTLAT